MTKVNRVKRSEATWRKLFVRQGSSGVTVAELCRREGINAGLFRRWRAALSQPDKSRAVKVAAKPAQPTSSFIDLGGLGSGGSRFEARLELGAGVVLSIARG